MPRKGNTVSVIISAVVFIILEAAALTLLYYRGPIQRMWIAQGGHWLMYNVWGGSESVRHYFSLNKENERLSLENQQLWSELSKYRSEADNRAYAEAVTDTIDSFHFIPAKIRKISNNRQHNYIMLGKGSDDGVRPMSGVISEHGVLGIVDVVSRHYCYARSFKNVDMEVSARLRRDGPVGILSWDGIHDTGAILDGVAQHIPVEEGDTIFTSGYSDMFPSDIPLGIAGDKTVVNGTYYRIRVRLFEDPGTRRFATIVCNTDIDEIKSLEEEEEE
ncbi:MAG: rod shape-determining protein MreC [Bacteroidales bacterium]|nr:rod shape-determining protein MreC [Bacteroidales bacterium]